MNYFIYSDRNVLCFSFVSGESIIDDVMTA